MSLIWTTDNPTEPGWYWARYTSAVHLMVRVNGTAPFLRIASVHNSHADVTSETSGTEFKEWAGPIPEPTEAPGA